MPIIGNRSLPAAAAELGIVPRVGVTVLRIVRLIDDVRVVVL